MKALNTYVVSLAVLLVATAAPSYAQQASSRSCSGRDPIGYIGISGIECNCTISSPGSGIEWRFRTEPKITSLEMDSRAANVLKTGDVIIAVNEKLITTREGALEFANIRPGTPLVLTLRRNGSTMKVALTPESMCPTDSRAMGIYAPAAPAGTAPSAVYVGRAPGVAVPRAEAPGMTPPPQAYVAAMAPTAYASMPRASFGMGLTCSRCSMSFSEKTHTASMSFSRPPEVYSIERDGPADRAGIRRGDVITHVDGKRIDTDEGGNIFANAKPGQTVRFTVVRNSQTRLYPVKAVSRATTVPPSPELAQSSRYLERARESLTQLQRSQQEQLRRLQGEVRRTEGAQEQELREAQRQMLREEQEHQRRLYQLAEEMSRAERQMRAAIVDSARAACAIAPTALSATTARARTLRYTGTLGDAEIEVRGGNPVSVTEDGDEVVITTGATVVRIQKKK